MKDSDNQNKRPYGQPYYDENGVFHSGLENGESTDEMYNNQYKQQMEEYRKMYGEDFEKESENVNPEFIPYEDRYKYAAENNPQQGQQNVTQGNTSSHSQRKSSSQKPPQKKQAVQKKNTSGSGQKKKTSGKSTNSGSSARKKKNSSAIAKKSAGNPKGKKKKMKKNRHPVRTFFTILLIIIFALVIGLNIFLISCISKINKVKDGERTITNASIKSNDVRNVLVIGSDSRNPKDRGRTDTIILLSINKSTKQIVMTSFMRDMYVNIKGKNDNGENVDTWGKINSAYVYGGAELLMDTIEHNFDVSIDDYVYFGFDSFIDIVNAVGGVNISVTDEEAKGMQPQTMEINDILKREHTKDILTKGGEYNMNGYQALAYARLRYVGNADFQRTERQREVVSKIIEKVKKNPFIIGKLGSTAAKSISTNMSNADIYFLFYKCLFSMKYEIKNLRLPEDDTYQYGNHDGQSTLDVDFNACQKAIKEKIYSGINDDDE